MNICLEGPKGDWDWFDADLREPDLGLDFNKIKAVCKTSNPMVIDIEYNDNEVDLDGILKFDGMGWTSINALINEAEDLAQYDDDALQKIAMYMRVKSDDLEDAKNHYDNYWTVCTDDPDPTSLAYEMVKEFGISEEDAANYFDYEAFGRDLLIDGYETDETDEYTVGEEYIDGVYGDVANYIAEVGVENIEPYFDFDAYGRNLAFGWSYDDVSGCWMGESVKKNRRTYIKESYSDGKYTGNTWNDFIDDIEFNSDYKVDSAYRRRPTEWIELIDSNGNIYDAEVTFYVSDSNVPQIFELMSYNIKPSYQYESIKRSNSRKRINKRRCESTNRRCKTRRIVKESTNAIVYTGVDWKDFTHDIESQGIYLVSPSCKNRPCKYIKLIDADTDLCFKGLVQKLPNGGFKLHDGDISANPSSCESIRKKIRTFKESLTKHQYDILQNACMNCNTISDLDSILGSLLTVNKNLYLKYNNKAVHDNYSASALAKDISDDLYYAFPEYND